MFTLIAQIDRADLPAILRAGECIVLVKNIGEGAPIAWAIQAPLENNSFEWGGDYSLFVTTVGDQVGVQVTIMSYTNAQGGCSYAFEPSLMFGAGVVDPGLGPDDYRIDNRVPASSFDALSFGLAQSINGSGSPQPLNSQFVPAMQSLTQSGCESITIWLQSGIDAGQIVTIPPAAQSLSDRTIRSHSLVVNFAAGTRTQTVKYSAALGRFELA
jgi:hypothetical protein